MLGSVNKLSIDAGHFCVKSATGSWKNAMQFSGKLGNLSTKKRDDSEAGALHQSIKPIYGKNPTIYTAIGLSDTIIREVNVPAELSEYEIEGAIEIELGDTLPFSLDQVYFDYFQIDGSDPEQSTQDTRKYMVAACRRDIIDNLTNEITIFDKKQSSINVDINGYAYGRLVSLLYAQELENEIVLLVDVGHQNTRFYFYDDKELVFHREQQIGGKFVTESIAEVYDLDEVEAIKVKHFSEHDSDFYQLVLAPFLQSFVEQVGLALDFFEASGKSERNVGKIVFTGGGVCLDGFYDGVKERLSHPSEIINLVDFVSEKVVDDQDVAHFSANYALALALLLDGAEK